MTFFSYSKEDKQVLRRSTQQMHVVTFSEVAHQLHNEADVGFLVQQILVFALIGPHIALSLLKPACAGAVWHHELVAHHPTGLALQVLHLVCQLSPLQNFQKSLLDFLLRKRRVAISTRPLCAWDFQVVVFVELSGPANIQLYD